jgi:anion-transporting  ArsA/GET3 family ATPase
VRDVLVTGKIKEAVTRKDGTRQWYDAVVVDAPPTGRIGRFLNITHEVGGIAKVGPLKAQSDGVMQVLTSAMTAVHVVTLLEEMPVQESLDAITELRELGMPVGGLIVNMVRRAELTPQQLASAAAGSVDTAALTAELAAVGIDGGHVGGLVTQAEEHAQRATLEESGRDALAEADRPTYELPLLPEVDLSALYELAELLQGQGAA